MEMPPELSLFIISSTDEYHAAVANGYNFSGCPKNENIEDGLNKGACLLCIFQNQALAHTSWLALNYNQSVYDSLFITGRIGQEGDSYIGPCNTYPTFRGRGLYPLALRLACQHIKSKGADRIIINTKKTNRSSMRGIDKADFIKFSWAIACCFFGYKFTYFGFKNNMKI